MSDQKYNIIREQGEFMEPLPLNDEENKIVIASENANDDND